MGDVISLFKDKSCIDERRLTPELIREYKDTILLVHQHQDQLEKEDWVHAYGMVLSFNNLLLKHIEEIDFD